MSTSTHTIFLIEDHPLVRKVLHTLLESEADLSVMAEAESAESALVQLEGMEPDLILTDLSLPGASGLEFVALLKRNRPELRCVVITGHNEAFYRAAALAAGAVGYVSKDDPDEVLKVVRQVLATPAGG